MSKAKRKPAPEEPPPVRSVLPTVPVPLSALRPHPRNYRKHSPDQLAHIVESIKEHGFYRPVISARDGTILAGHGLVLAARQMGLEEVPVFRLDLDPADPRALKVLTGDNEISRLAEIDDRALSELLKEVKDVDLEGLLGTGYDDQMLAALVFVTRPKDEIEGMNEAAEWVGMPEFGSAPETLQIRMMFRNAEDRKKFVAFADLKPTYRAESTWTAWWPPKEREDLASVRFEG